MSAFLAADSSEVDALCATRLVRFASVAVFTRASVIEAGLDVVPTFRTPHVTLAHDDLDELVRRLLPCEHETLVFPYHEDEE